MLLGGSPLRLVTLSAGGRRAFAALRGGATVGAAGPGADVLGRRLVEAGLLHPLPPPQDPARDRITAVVPVRDGEGRIGPLVAALRGECAEVIVVDDGSRDETAAQAEAAGARVLRHDRSRGPGAARTTGSRAAGTDLIAFCDADVHPVPGWLDRLAVHLADPAVVAVAPRVSSPVPPGRPAGLRHRYEADRSPLDLGARGAAVHPGSRVSYVPTAALLIRRDHVDFDPALRHGEDVDLVWRLLAAGHCVRYEPAAVVRHEPRASWSAWARQRHDYGSSAARLARRHPGPLRPSGAAAGTVLAAGVLAVRPDRVGVGLTGMIVAGAGIQTAARLSRRLSRVEGRAGVVLALTARQRRRGLLFAAETARRTWLPVLVGAAGCRAGRLLLVSVALPLVHEWWVRRPAVGLVPYVLVRLMDDSAYSVGVWAGCLAERSLTPLLPARPRRPWAGRSREASV
ncbi:mycofactocin glycosyltransferase [Frankia sp. AiPs1]|uniref:mycofactocin biosynthesis glycosyltransferase MftF n=1 Tax=Frankia sp. AiPa1 TaxID=573492 RepID=UPI00202B6F17|nr:mycofactocin biosynthesis glycosyltransferase MftF [Frankia sp. AiPa1]